MAVVSINEYLDDWLRAQEGKRISDRDKEKEVIDLMENKNIRANTYQAGKKEKNYNPKEKENYEGSTKGGKIGETTYLRKNPKFVRLW